MALPRKTDPYESYTEQLVYFSARLAANPHTESLAEGVEALLSEIDASHEAVLVAKRAEVRARALRDHHDSLGDARVRRLKRRLDAIDTQLSPRLFPRGIRRVVEPRGRPQIDQLGKLGQAIESLAGSPRTAAHADADEIEQVLEHGLAIVAEFVATLTPLVEAWEDETLFVARAADVFNFRRDEGVARLGAMLGELRARLGGDARAAYAYTQPPRRNRSSGDEAAIEDGAELEEAELS